jgi:hypothetical protein
MNFFKILVIVVAIALLIVFSPLLTIWAVNTIFPSLAIPYNVETWFATMIIGAFLKTKVSISR